MFLGLRLALHQDNLRVSAAHIGNVQILYTYYTDFIVESTQESVLKVAML